MAAIHPRPRHHVFIRDGERLVVCWRAVGLTLWRQGAAGIQVNGHMVQGVLGDWWKAMPHARGRG